MIKIRGFVPRWMVAFFALSIGCSLHKGVVPIRRTSVLLKYPQAPACPSTLYASIHDLRKEVSKKYIDFNTKTISNLDRQIGLDVPVLKALREDTINYVIWEHRKTIASAWTENDIIEGLGFVPPEKELQTHMNVTGNFICFLNFFDRSYGHYNNHNLPIIAWLRDQVPSTTRFILHDSILARKVLHYLDADFYNKVIWLSTFHRLQIHGSLTVPILHSRPMHSGDMRPMKHLQQWIFDKKEVVDLRKKYVVFYSRLGASHNRILAHEEEVLQVIQHAMEEYTVHRNLSLVVFTGKNADGSMVSIKDQHDIFRSAHTIIGPHGGGLLGNLVWTDPFPETCADRTKVLEFITADDSAQVQNNSWATSYTNFRKWPLDYHVITYTAKSNSNETYVNIDALQTALSAMWRDSSVAAPKIETS